MTFHSVGNVIIPTDELIFFRGVGLNHQPENLKKHMGNIGENPWNMHVFLKEKMEKERNMQSTLW